jgi:Sigma-70 region 2
MGKSPEHLIRDARRGKEAAFLRLFDEHYRPLFRFAWRLTGSVAEAEDVVQECFLALLGPGCGFDPERTAIRTYLFGAVRSQARRFGVGAKNPDRFAGLNEQRFVVFKIAQGSDDGVEGGPIACGAAGAAVDDELVGLFGNLGVEVVHEHAEGGFLMPTFAGDLASTGRAHDRGHNFMMVRILVRGCLQFG